MKKLMLICFIVYALSACQSMPGNSNDTDEKAGLSTQYSEDKTTGNTAADINAQLGAGYIGNNRYDRALVKLQKAIKQDPEHALAHNYLGVLYGRLERPELATKEFKKSISLSPNNSSILNNYAIFLCKQKDYSEAQKFFKNVINNPLYINRAGAYQSAGWCALENNELAMSEKMYLKALSLSPELPRSLLGMAKINYHQAKYDYAWSFFERYDEKSVLDADSLWLGINILKRVATPNKNLLSSYKLQLKSKYPDSEETRWLYQGKQEY